MSKSIIGTESIEVVQANVNVRDYGAIGDDIADDTLAFRNALNAIRSTGGICYVPTGTYKIAPSGIMGINAHAALTSNMHLVGSDGVVPATGSPRAFLHIHSDLTQVVVTGHGNNWSIEKIGFDMSGFYGGTGANPVTVLSREPLSSNWLISRCWFLNAGKSCIVARGSNYQISNCNIVNNTVIAYVPPPAFGPAPEGVLSTIGPNSTYPSYGRYLNNVIDGCSGFDTLGNNHLFRGNICKNMTFAAGYFEGGAAANIMQNRDNTYIGNTAMFGDEGPDNLIRPPQPFTQARGFEIYTPYTFMLNNSAHDNCGGGFGMNCPRSVFVFNRSVNNGRETGNPLHSIDRSGFISSGLTGANRTINNSNSVYFGNTAVDTRPVGQKTQQYGLHVKGPPQTITCLYTIANNFHGNRVGEGFYNQTQPNVSVEQGRDMFLNKMDERQRNMIRALLDRDSYSITDGQYILLNRLITGSSRPRP